MDKLIHQVNAPAGYSMEKANDLSVLIFNTIKGQDAVQKTDLFPRSVFENILSQLNSDVNHQSYKYKQMFIFGLWKEFCDYYDTTLSSLSLDNLKDTLQYEITYHLPTYTAVRIYNENVNKILIWMYQNNSPDSTSEDEILIKSIGATVGEDGNVTFITVPETGNVDQNQDDRTYFIVVGTSLLLLSIFFIKRFE